MLELNSAQAFISLIVILLIFPTYRAITRWILDRLLSWWEFFLLQMMTGSIIVYLFQHDWYKSTLVVLIAYNIFWLFEPSLRHLTRSRTLRNQDDMEINRNLELIKQFPDNPVYHTALGDLYFARRRYDEAIAAYRAAISLLPDKFNGVEQRKLEQALAARNSSRDASWR